MQVNCIRNLVKSPLETDGQILQIEVNCVYLFICYNAQRFPISVNAKVSDGKFMKTSVD